MDIEQRAAPRKALQLFGRAELHENSGERLRETVVNFLPDAIALDEHRRRLAGVRETRELDGERRLLSKRDEQLLRLRADRLAMAERQGDTAHRAIAEHQRDDIHAHQALFAACWTSVPGQTQSASPGTSKSR